MSKVPIALEATWLVLAILCISIGIHSTISVGFGQSYMFFLLTVVAAIMYFIRRYRRKNFSSNQNIDK